MVPLDGDGDGDGRPGGRSGVRPWLLPAFSTLARLIAPLYYRLSYAGVSVPRTGPVLLVANHPNSLFDPVLVTAAARRPVRFLAKSLLFTDRKVGWLVRASGAIPVYRRQDDPEQVGRNEEMFRAVQDALGSGAAVAIFPEGISHSGPQLTRLKTGAARIAMGYATAYRRPVPVVPVGLVFRSKDVFRSTAQVVVGRPVRWEDLVWRAPDDVDAARELTRRIEAAIRGVTVNLEAWEDRPVVECALDIWELSQRERPDAGGRVARLRTTTHLLRLVRESGNAEVQRLIDRVRRHCQRLHRLGLAPADLSGNASTGRALGWGARRVLLLTPPALALGTVGAVVFLLPYLVTGRLVRQMRPDLDQVSTHKLLIGIPVYGLWIIGVGVVVGATWSWFAALAAVLLLPGLGFAGLRMQERWRGARSDARRFFSLRTRAGLVTELRTAQQALAVELDDLYRSLIPDPGPPT